MSTDRQSATAAAVDPIINKARENVPLAHEMANMENESRDKIAILRQLGIPEARIMQSELREQLESQLRERAEQYVLAEQQIDEAIISAMSRQGHSEVSADSQQRLSLLKGIATERLIALNHDSTTDEDKYSWKISGLGFRTYEGQRRNPNEGYISIYYRPEHTERKN